MRLLECTSGDNLVLTRDLIGDDKIPPYAILSHTWEDGQEVTFTDVRDGTGQDKTGYNKIRFCKQQAKRDGLQYIWVDTCSIEKSNHVELQDAINSMFHWYRNAETCYVYLQDVSTSKRKVSDDSSERAWETAFRRSKWFTRGWTLQELLAPRSVEFFSREGKSLGNKSTLEQQIQEITGIDSLALRGKPLNEFSIEERLSWAKRRHTTRKEDRAYSLLGIFGIYMSLIYGEGEENAFKRLRKKIDRPTEGVPQQQASTRTAEKNEECIQQLRITDPRIDKKRIEDTKGGLLEDSYHWIFENADFQQWRDEYHSRLLWIKGDPGKGKTMLLCGIINELKKSMAKTDLLSYFFCQATDARINNATAILRGLMYLLIDLQPLLISHVRKKYDHAGRTLYKDINTWTTLCEIFIDMLQDLSLNSTYLIIDALDECIEGLPQLLDFLVRTSSMTSHIKWIVSSRNWLIIEERLGMLGHKVKLSLELNAESVSTAVDSYIRYRVARLAQEKNYNIETRNAVSSYLFSNADNTFLWVALVCQNLRKFSRWKVLIELKTFPPGLDSLYKRMMHQINTLDDAALYRRILALIAVVYRPITLEELTALVEELEDMDNDSESLREIISLCGSFLTIRDVTIYFIHQSAKDFLLTEAFDIMFPTGKDKVHYTIFSRSLLAMSKTLRRDMYGLGELGYHINQITRPDPDPLVVSRYSSIYWIDHLCDWNSSSSANPRLDLQDRGAVDIFLREKYLYWLEALSLHKSISKGIVSVAKLEAVTYAIANASSLSELVRDARRFIMYHKRAIESNPLQAYGSALLFSPTGSLTRRLFKHEEPKHIIIKPVVDYSWSACLLTLEDHSDSVKSVAYSHDSTRLASASYDSTVKVWDTDSGECMLTMKDQSSDYIHSVAFSHDSTWLASAAADIKVWDTRSGECVLTLEGLSIDSNYSVAFSHNSTWLAAADDNIVKIWDTRSGECVSTLKGHSTSITSVDFSHDSTWLASADDKIVKVWDTHSGECVSTLGGHSSFINSVAFSHDSTWLASASYDCTIMIWDTYNSKCKSTLVGHSDSVNSVAFSHDSTRLASASDDRTVKVWDTHSGECMLTLTGHTSFLNSVAFTNNSTRLASASDDRTVKVWDTHSSEYLSTHECHSDSVRSVAFSHNSTWLATASNDMTVKVWDTYSGKCVLTLEGHNYSVRSVAFSHNSTWLASTSGDMTVKVWDTHSGKCVLTLKSGGSTSSITFSHNSNWLALGLFDNSIKVWDTHSGNCVLTLEGHNNSVRSVAFSHNSDWLASASDDKTVKVWDTYSGKCVLTLEGHSHYVISVAFSYNSTWLASASHDSTVKVWDTHSGNCILTLQVGRSLYSISFDISNLYLQTDIGAIDIRALSSSRQNATSLAPQTPQYQGLALSASGEWITYDSTNLLWLPSEYRPSYSAVSGNMVGIGVESGRVWICKVEYNVS